MCYIKHTDRTHSSNIYMRVRKQKEKKNNTHKFQERKRKVERARVQMSCATTTTNVQVLFSVTSFASTNAIQCGIRMFIICLATIYIFIYFVTNKVFIVPTKYCRSS